MQSTDIAAVFNRTYRGAKNVLTPNVEGYYKKGEYLFELSWGKGLGSPKMYGVTVLNIYGQRTNLSKSFQSKTEARDYIKSFDKKTREGLTDVVH